MKLHNRELKVGNTLYSRISGKLECIEDFSPSFIFTESCSYFPAGEYQKGGECMLWLSKEQADLAVAEKVKAACAIICEPKGPRPCDCTSCSCGNYGDTERVAAWDADNANAQAIEALDLTALLKGE